MTNAGVFIYGRAISPEDKLSDLRGRDFSYADVAGQNLSGLNMEGINLKSAVANRANFSRAKLAGADLVFSKLYEADFTGADLTGADLSEAYLPNAKFDGANLTGAKLIGTDLKGATFKDAVLTGTVLDPEAKIPEFSDSQLAVDGLELETGGLYVYGWRTRYSINGPAHKYEVGQTYVAPVFSVCPHTECHPGIYLAGRDYMFREFDSYGWVRCRTLRSDLHKAVWKWRTRRLEVIDAS